MGRAQEKKGGYADKEKAERVVSEPARLLRGRQLGGGGRKKREQEAAERRVGYQQRRKQEMETGRP